VNALSRATDARDPYTAGHQRRVSDLAVDIGSELGLGTDQLEFLKIAGALHDIGKIGLPAEILSKPGTLHPLEIELVRTHPQTGAQILADIEFPWPVQDVVAQHHERLDGSGYPDGFAGDQIRLEARIVAVADVVEAMCSHRPYRNALPLSAALDELSSGRGIRYDTAVVDAAQQILPNWHTRTYHVAT
jgi:putative nucleotidyltransferase with HDIG domain